MNLTTMSEMHTEVSDYERCRKSWRGWPDRQILTEDTVQNSTSVASVCTSARCISNTLTSPGDKLQPVMPNEMPLRANVGIRTCVRSISEGENQSHGAPAYFSNTHTVPSVAMPLCFQMHRQEAAHNDLTSTVKPATVSFSLGEIRKVVIFLAASNSSSEVSEPALDLHNPYTQLLRRSVSSDHR